MSLQPLPASSALINGGVLRLQSLGHQPSTGKSGRTSDGFGHPWPTCLSLAAGPFLLKFGRPRKSTQTPSRRAVEFLVPENSSEAEAVSELKLGQLLSWSRQQSFMKLHPCLSFSCNQLQVSVPVEAGTPILGVLEDAFLCSSEMPEGWQKVLEAARERYPDWWALHLGISLLKEKAHPSSDIWEAYQKGVSAPAALTLWSGSQAQELQYVPIKKELVKRIEAIREAHQELLVPAQLGDELPSVFDLAQAVATAARAIEVSVGQRALLPLLDLVGPPEATVLPGEATPEANCELQVEVKGGPGGRSIAILLAARDLRPGEALCRAWPEAMAADQLMLELGLASTRPDDVTIHVGLKKDVVEPWQLSTLREVMDLEPGEAPGDWMASAKVRRSPVLTKAVDAKLIAAARVLSGKSRDEVLGAEWNLMTKDEILNAGFEGLSSTRRRRVLWVLKRAVEGALASYETSVTRDQEILDHLEGRERAAVAYRLGKKLILREVQAQLEKADAKIQRKRVQREKDATLPSVVTGKKRAATPGKGFG